jgi:MYXO-CTERM domain-containing protein
MAALRLALALLLSAAVVHGQSKFHRGAAPVVAVPLATGDAGLRGRLGKGSTLLSLIFVKVPLSTCAPVVAVRLVNGSAANNGRLEVKIFGREEWGTVCDDGFNANESSTVCNILGMPGPATVAAFGQFGAGNKTSQVFYRVFCRSVHQSLNDCGLEWNPPCGHHEDVGVICSTQAAQAGSKTPVAAIVAPIVAVALLAAAAALFIIRRRKRQQGTDAGKPAQAVAAAAPIPIPNITRVGEACAPQPVAIRIGDATAVPDLRQQPAAAPTAMRI